MYNTGNGSNTSSLGLGLLLVSVNRDDRLIEERNGGPGGFTPRL